MKRLTLKLNQKLWLLVSSGVIFTVLVTYGLTQYLYGKLYVQNIKSSLIYQGQRIADMCPRGGLTPAFLAEVERISRVSEAEIFVTENPRQLGACLPFEIEYDALITQEERSRLVAGETVSKIGYEGRFGRQIMAVIIPLLDGKRLQGIVYLYVPLASITEALSEVRYIILVCAFVFVLFSLYIVRRLVNRLTKPLRDMEQTAGEMALGDFTRRFTVTETDEVGNLGRALNHMASALEQVDAQRREFLANVSHELRTPLSYMKGYSEAIIDGIAVDPEDRDRYLHLIHREAGRMERLVHDLLDLAQLEGASYPLQAMPLPLGQLIEDTVDKFRPFLMEKGASLQLDIDPDVIVWGDEDRLEQVIHNLCDNALRHLPDQAGRLHVSLRRDEQAHRCVVTIADNGCGIAPEEMARVGERFYRVDKARTRKHGGSGLGISIVKQIVHLHEGTFGIESKVGEGTVVTVCLPLYEENEEE
ncbi:HAMP domain-containing protein [Aneurinibacillus sp. BA2021]|nr:HAMP domain-containing protein [Aneurinibacillus sp. BA2021]